MCEREKEKNTRAHPLFETRPSRSTSSLQYILWTYFKDSEARHTHEERRACGATSAAPWSTGMPFSTLNCCAIFSLRSALRKTSNGSRLQRLVIVVRVSAGALSVVSTAGFSSSSMVERSLAVLSGGDSEESEVARRRLLRFWTWRDSPAPCDCKMKTSSLNW